MNDRSIYTAPMSPAAVAAAGLAALAAGMGIGRFAFTPILPLMQAEGTLTLAGGGWLAAANYAGYLAGALTATLVSASVALRTRPALSGTVYAGVGVGAALAGAVCLAALRFHLTARDVWLVLGAIALAVAAALWPLFAEGKRAAAHAAPLRWSGQSLLLVACYGAFGFSYIIPATFIPAFAREALGDAALYGWAWPLFGAAAAASTVAAAPLVRRFGARSVWVGGHLVMALGLLAPLVLPGAAGIMACALCVGVTFMVITMAGLQEARRLFGGGVLAAMTAGFAAGQIAGPAFVSVLSRAGGRPEHAWIGACVVLVAAAAALFFRRPQP